jgi:hypothetical protein
MDIFGYDTLGYIKLIAQLAQVLAVVVGVVISVRTFTASRERESAERRAEAKKQRFEMQKYREQRDSEARHPYVELRQKLYLDAIHAAAVLANPSLHDDSQIATARTRFWELYWGELSLVEGHSVEKAMIELGTLLEPSLDPTAAQEATYHLSHKLRDSLKKTWGIDEPQEPETP